MTPTLIELETVAGKITLNLGHVLFAEPAGPDKIGQTRILFVNGMQAEFRFAYSDLREAITQGMRGF